jgi:hypothetical protein
VIQSHAAHASRAPAIRALPRCRTGIPGHTKGGRVPTRRAGCARRDSDPHDLAATDPSSLRVYQFRHERMRAPDPDRTGACRLRGGRSCRLSYKGIAGTPGFEPGKLPGQGRAGLPVPPCPIQCGRCESNAHAARFELARSASCRHSRLVRCQGFEPDVPRIKSPVHSQTCSQRLEPHAGIEPAFPAWRAGTLAVVLVRRSASPLNRPGT